MPYSIIIPIYNEEKTLNNLLLSLKKYFVDGDEIIIVNDGSSDDSQSILNKCKHVKSIHLEKNFGKGFALKKGLLYSKYEKIIIYDGDLELSICDISKLKHLNRKEGVKSIMGIRSKSFNPFKLGNDWGNFIFTFFFNILHFTVHKDILCCAKSFYKNDIPYANIKSKSFDIDVELSYLLSKINRGKNILQVSIDYNRRTVQEGKKLKTSDGFLILNRILLNLLYQ